MQKRFSHDGAPAVDLPEFASDSRSIGTARKRKALCELTPACIVNVLHSVLVEKLKYSDAADVHNIKPALVCQLMNKSKKDPDFISKRREKELVK